MSLLSNIWFHSIFSKSGACFSIFQWCLLRSKFWILVSTVYQFLLSWMIVNEAFRKESLISVSITGGLSLHSDVCGDGCRPCEHMQEPRCPAVGTGQAASAPATTQGPWLCPPHPLLWRHTLLLVNVRWKQSQFLWLCGMTFSKVEESESVSCSVVSGSFVTPWTVASQAPLSMESSRQEYLSGFPFLLQGIFPTQGLNPDLPCCRRILYLRLVFL